MQAFYRAVYRSIVATQSLTSYSACVFSLRAPVSVKVLGYLLRSTRKLLVSNVMRYTLEQLKSAASKKWVMIMHNFVLARDTW